MKREIIIPGNTEETIEYCVEHFIASANKFINDNGCFSVALSGGTTPKQIYEKLSDDDHRNRVPWDKVKLFWSDERPVSANDLESNYRMAMDGGFSKLPVSPKNIFRMEAENDVEAGALNYEKTIKEQLTNGKLDMVMLGMGDDGHTASLFPQTDGLRSLNRLVIANYIPQKKTWRMTLTFDAINHSSSIVVYILGSSKASMVNTVLNSEFKPDIFPIQNIGTKKNKALWILDTNAASYLGLEKK